MLNLPTLCSECDGTTSIELVVPPRHPLKETLSKWHDGYI